MIPYSDEIFDSSYRLFCRDSSNDVRKASIIPMKNLLRKKELSAKLDIDLKNVYEYLVPIARDAKTPKGLRSEIMKLLGLFVEA